MDTNLFAALIGAFATLVAALITLYGKSLSGLKKRKSLGFPDIKGQWRATWYLDDQEDPYLEDIVVIETIKGMTIKGEGVNSGKGNYPIEGKFTNNLILNFIYESGSSYVS